MVDTTACMAPSPPCAIAAPLWRSPPCPSCRTAPACSRKPQRAADRRSPALSNWARNYRTFLLLMPLPFCSADVGGFGSLRSRPPSEKPCTEPTARTGSACAARYEPCFGCRFAACYMTHQVVHLKLHCSCCGKTIPPDKQNQRHHVKCTGPGWKAFKRTADHADHGNSMTIVDARTPTE